MTAGRMTRTRFACLAALLALGCPLAVFSQGPEAVSALLAVHRAWKFTPTSLEITGMSMRGSITEPIRIMATNQEDVLIEYGEKKRVATKTSHFRDDGTKISRESTPAGFTQLDVTSVFWLSQLSNMPLRAAASAKRTVSQEKAFQIVPVSTGRSEVHFSRYKVDDAFDLFIAEDSGLLAGISRSFYAERPDFAFTYQTAFSDYREVGGVLLPYRIDRYMQGRLVETITVSQYAVDVPAAPSLFAPRRTR